MSQVYSVVIVLLKAGVYWSNHGALCTIAISVLRIFYIYAQVRTLIRMWQDKHTYQHIQIFGAPCLHKHTFMHFVYIYARTHTPHALHMHRYILCACAYIYIYTYTAYVLIIPVWWVSLVETDVWQATLGDIRPREAAVY